ncbi:MAG TPA: hypothetical protein VKQ36_09035 [Ktedonobacterales bacterium]|nr:hypothetical protein [Ktedonobacterales bacterium]
MRDTRLLFVEGIMGAGKSTTAEYLDVETLVAITQPLRPVVLYLYH